LPDARHELIAPVLWVGKTSQEAFAIDHASFSAPEPEPLIKHRGNLPTSYSWSLQLPLPKLSVDLAQVLHIVDESLFSHETPLRYIADFTTPARQMPTVKRVREPTVGQLITRSRHNSVY
jgi:hypothetical protein